MFHGPLTLRRAILLCLGIVTACFALLLAVMLWQQAEGQMLAGRADMARVQALLVTRIEADIAFEPIAAPPAAATLRGTIGRNVAAYLATVDDERDLIGTDDDSLAHQTREAAEARLLSALTTGPATPDRIAAARRLARTIALRENHEAEAAGDEARRFARRSQRAILIVFALLWCAFLAVALLLWRKVIRPVESLIRATDDVAAETAPARVVPAGPSEIRRLIRHFNGMARAVEDQVSRRTAELERANDALRNVDRQRRLFLSTVSHELRTPATVIRCEAEVALRVDEDVAGLRRALHHILDSNVFLQRRLDDLQTLALAEDGALSIAADRVDLAEVVRAVEQSAGAFARSSGVHLDVAPVPDAVTVTGDADRLRQALVAILDNSVKFSPPGGRVWLRLDVDGGEGRIRIGDEGPGVADEALERIFDPYHRGQAARSAGGTGIGLSLARWIAHAHRGRIAAHRNATGEGLCVSLTLPVTA